MVGDGTGSSDDGDEQLSSEHPESSSDQGDLDDDDGARVAQSQVLHITLLGRLYSPFVQIALQRRSKPE